MRSRFIFTVLCGAMALPSCGSDQDLASPNQVECGPGTRLEGGRCVVDEGGAGSGGSTASGGASGQAVGGEGGSATGGTGGDSGGGEGGGAGGADAGAAGSPGPGPEDDPCPPEGLPMDCSGQCDVVSPRCEMATCREEGPYGVTVTEESELPYIFRTPSHPGVDPACGELCDGPVETAYGTGVKVIIKEEVPNTVLKATVGSPWRIVIMDYMWADYCITPTTPYGCDCSWEGSYTAFVVVTDDPNAPARNVKIERVPAPGSCP